MKQKLMLFLSAVMCSLNAAAQMMPDSTVQICAWWNPGDVISYIYNEQKFNIDEKGDTTVTGKSSEVLTFEVLSATKDTYHLALSYSEPYDSDPDNILMTQAMLKVAGPIVIEFDTDQYGTFIGVTNLEEIVSKMSKGLKTMVDYIYSERGKDINVPRKKMERFMRNSLCRPEMVENLVNDDIVPILFFHGICVKPDTLYSFSQTYPSLVAGADSLCMDSEFYVDSEFTDSVSAVIRSYEVAGRDAVCPFLSSLFPSIVESFGGKNAGQESEEFLAKLLDSMDASIENWTTLEVHLDSGWPLQWFFDREITVTADGKTNKNCVSKSLAIKWEDE